MNRRQLDPLVFLRLLTNAFPLWVLAGGALALWHPPWFTWFTGDWITWGLAVIMLGMGITLRVEDFRAVARAPRVVGLGFGAQYLIMPSLGWSIAHALDLPTPYAVGLILVSCCPGGTASNVVTFLAGGRLALSVLMTMASTLAAVIMTPLLTKGLAGTLVPVPATGLLLSTVKVVLAPVLLGLALHHLAPRAVRWILPAAPLVSVITIALICASIIGSSANALRSSGGRLLWAVVLLHSGGFGLGYLAAHLGRQDPTVCRTVSIEVGMQNSGLGAVLARTHFADPLTALPCALSATVHSVIGSLLAGWWRWRGAGGTGRHQRAAGAPSPGPAAGPR
ncbi:MAG: bile acid:sodium symporter family protein [Verrucomicrobia bacterium]|nr:bile acid:sodium symporter family protein [Verrucomicrobiota bacterium]